MAENILEVHDLEIRYVTDEETVQAVNDITFSLERGESIGLVGETGAGKTTTALGIMGLVPDPPGEIVKGSILFEGEDLLKLSEKQMRRIRGGKISMIFQDPMTSLNPVTRVGDQIAEVILLHNKISKAEARKRAMEMLEQVGIPGARCDDYPHQFSGGMKHAYHLETTGLQPRAADRGRAYHSLGRDDPGAGAGADEKIEAGVSDLPDPHHS